jgi:aspartate 1-decarboxylase
MLLTLLKAKIHRTTTTAANLAYEGSITIDGALLQAAGILPFEQVDVVNCANGARFTTYAITGGPGEICVNGAAARLVQPGDLLIVLAYAQFTPAEAAAHTPCLVFVDEQNRISSIQGHAAA